MYKNMVQAQKCTLYVFAPLLFTPMDIGYWLFPANTYTLQTGHIVHLRIVYVHKLTYSPCIQTMGSEFPIAIA